MLAFDALREKRPPAPWTPWLVAAATGALTAMVVFAVWTYASPPVEDEPAPAAQKAVKKKSGARR